MNAKSCKNCLYAGKVTLWREHPVDLFPNT